MNKESFKVTVSEATVFVNAKSLVNNSRFKWTLMGIGVINLVAIAIYVLV